MFKIIYIITSPNNLLVENIHRLNSRGFFATPRCAVPTILLPIPLDSDVVLFLCHFSRDHFLSKQSISELLSCGFLEALITDQLCEFLSGPTSTSLHYITGGCFFSTLVYFFPTTCLWTFFRLGKLSFSTRRTKCTDFLPCNFARLNY